MATKKIVANKPEKEIKITEKPKKNAFTKQDLIKLLIFAAVLAIITALTAINLFSDPKSLDNFFAELKTANIFWAIVVFVVVPVIWLVTDSFVLWMMTKRTYTVYKFRQALSAVGLYVIFSLLTPFQSGGQIFQIIYMRKQGVKYSTAVSATVAAAVMFQFITVPVSTGLFAYATMNGNIIGDLVIEGVSSNLIWGLTALALGVNLLLMIIPILISVSTRALNALARTTASFTGLSYRKIENAERDAKIFLGITGTLFAFAVFLWLFGPHIFGPSGLFERDVTVFIVLSLLTFLWTRIHFLELTNKKYKKKIKAATESMLVYKDTFKSTVFNKKILIPCLIAMFIKEMNHSFSIVWSALMVGEDVVHWFDLMVLKNVLTLAQTTIPTPGGSGGAEFFYIAAAGWEFGVGTPPAVAIGLITRFSTYWFLLIWAFVFKTWWRPSRDGYGIPERARLKKKNTSKISKVKKLISETQVLNIKKGK